MPDADSLEVLLSTYNGEPFLEEQLDSILDQQGHACRILARDDGSSDGTRELLAAYARRFPRRLTILRDRAATGDPKLSYARLLGASTAPYVMLADQDDVWKPNKARLSMDAMLRLERRRGAARPCLVFTDLAVVDRALNVTSPSFWRRQRLDPSDVHRLPRLVRQNVVTGCTALLNRPLVSLARSIPSEVYMHDWWIALLACTLGEATYVPQPTVLYRQHGRNAVGVALPERRRLLPRLRRHERRKAEWERSFRQAEALLSIHSEHLAPRHRAVLAGLLRCERSTSRLVRVGTLVRYGFWHPELRHNLGTLWYLWDMNAAKRPSDRSSRTG